LYIPALLSWINSKRNTMYVENDYILNIIWWKHWTRVNVLVYVCV
jgi:hypothetical protein